MRFSSLFSYREKVPSMIEALAFWRVARKYAAQERFMATTVELGVQEAAKTQQPGRKINDFSIQVATLTAPAADCQHACCCAAIFQMGIPVSGKNMFPSNIAGLPTWFTIRASKHGYIARKKEIDLLVAMNAETAPEDVMTLDAGAAVRLRRAAEPLRLASGTSVPIPFPSTSRAALVCPEAKLRKLVKKHGDRCRRWSMRCWALSARNQRKRWSSTLPRKLRS